MDQLTKQFKKKKSPERAQPARANTPFKLALTTGALLSLAALFYIWTTFGETTIALSLKTNIDLERGLIAHYTFDGPDLLNNVVDKSGSGNTGYLTNFTSTTTTNGPIGQALEFDGSDDYVNITGVSDVSASCTMAAWVRLSSRNSVGSPILNATVNEGFRAEQFGSNSVGITRVSDLVFSSPGYTVPVDTWTHLVALINSSTAATLYVNGTESGTLTGSGLECYRSRIGSINGGADSLPGTIDDVRVYDRALSAEEISRLYELGKTTHIAKTLGTAETNPDLSRGLVGHWTFDGPDLLQNAVDKSGSGNTGYLTNFTSTTTTRGPIGQALIFRESSDYVNIADSSSFTFGSNDVTMSAWIRLDTAALGGTYDAIISQTNDGIELIHSNTSGLWVEIVDSDNGSHRARETTSSLTSAEVWYHVVGVYYTATGEHRLFVDGESRDVTYIDAQSTGTGVLSDPSADFTLGARNGSFPLGYQGDIDDVRVYDRALSAEEISRLYELGKTTHIAKTLGTAETNPDLSRGLVGHWTFDGPDLLQNAVDKSGSGNTGYLTNFTSTTTTRGPIGQALDFDGSDDYIETGSKFVNNDITVSAWVYTNFSYLTTDYPSIVGALNDAGSAGWSLYYRSNVDQWGFYSARTSTHVTPVSSTITSDVQLGRGKWQHIVGTADSSDGTLYIDGVSVGTDTGSGDATTPTSNVRIGDNNDFGSLANWPGNIDDVRIYNRALSADEVERLYKLGR